jgi:putative phosphoesterase
MDVTKSHGDEAIIIGLVSDTHGIVRPSVFEALAGVSRILHAGDVGGSSVLHVLGQIAPVQAVYGNVDPPDPPLQARLHVEAGGLTLHVSHGHELGSPTPRKLLVSYSADVIIYGHTHRALVHREGSRLVVNPGAAGPGRFGLRPSVGRLTISGGQAAIEIVELRV